MYQYRDSTFQFQHLTHSYYALYNEWMDDEDLPPPDDPLGGNNDNPTTTGNSVSQDGDVSTAHTDIDPMSGNINQAVSTPSNNSDNLGTQYWDYFDDEENWEIFNKFNLQVESNGRIIYNHIVGQDTTSNLDNNTTTTTTTTTTTNNNNDNSDNNEDISASKDVDIISGYLFDPRVLTRIRNKVNGWNEMGEHIS